MKYFTNGRVSRLNFFIAYVILTACYVALNPLLKSSLIGHLVLLLVIGIPGLSLAIRRLQDMGWSNWFAIIGFVPVVNIIFLLVLIFKAGTPGDNKYGMPPSTKVDAWHTIFPKTGAPV